MDLYCTHPSCTKPKNTFSDEILNSRSAKKILCSNCGMPLILQGHFVATNLLGSGGFGITFKTEDLDFPSTTRVIKQLHPQNRSGQILPPQTLQRMEEMFMREANTLDKLNHPRIPRFLGFFTLEFQEETGYKEKFFYLVQDYIEGQDLAKELDEKQNKKFSEDEVINILKEILNILKYIHDDEGTNGVIYIHRDIKPGNIMRCSTDGRLYLIDFGAVKEILQGVEVETTSIVHTPGFAPPEQFDHAVVSPASDLYATATTCLCLLTGVTETRQLVWNSNWKTHIKLSNKRFAEALDKMLRYEQQQRPQSAQEVLNILSAEESEPDGDGSATQLPEPDKSFSQTKILASKLHHSDSWFRKFINWVKQRTIRWRSTTNFILAFLLGIAITVAFNVINHKKTQDPPPFAEYFSRGEESLIPQLNKNTTEQICQEGYDLKQEGIKAFKKASLSGNNKDFENANTFFTKSIDKFQPDPNVIDSSKNSCIVDPETFIYQYNAKVAQTASARNGSLPTIAVVIPSHSNLDITLEILRGVAQILKEQNTNTPLFQILLAKDNNNLIQDVKKIANYIANNNIPEEFDYFRRSQNLGVIGRYTSRYIWEAGNIYGEKQLVLIAPTSTAIRKFDPTTLQPNLHHYVFRTASNDAIAAKDLVAYMWNVLQLKKVLIIYDSTDIHSKSLAVEFQNQLKNRDPNDANYQLCDLSAFKFNKTNCISRVNNAREREEALMLAPGHVTFNNVLNIAQLGAKRNLQILTGDVLYNRQTSKNPGLSTNKIKMAVFSHADEAKDNFKSQSRNLWGINKVSWRTITSYDAGQTLVQALTDLSGNGNPTRQNIYDKLNDTSFSAPGATTEVRFDQNHDRKVVTGVLVQLNKSDPNGDEYGFSLLQTPQRNNP